MAVPIPLEFDEIRRRADGLAKFRIRVRATPGAKKWGLEILDAAEPALRVRLPTPPVDGRANAALAGFLAGIFGRKTREVRLVGGERGREKIFEIEKLSR